MIVSDTCLKLCKAGCTVPQGPFLMRFSGDLLRDSKSELIKLESSISIGLMNSNTS